ncbi:hypothetical protein M569_13354, partial [Genlisea aurea]
IILGFQHYAVMLGTTVMIATLLVPQMGGGPGDTARVIQTLLFMSGLNTLFQTWIGTRLPTVIGPSYAYVIPVLGIINDLSDDSSLSDKERFVHTMKTIQGSLIISSFVNMLLGYSCLWGKLTRRLSPVVLVPTVCVAGLGLYSRGFPQLANCVEIGLPMLLLLVVTQQYLQHIHPRAQPKLERYALLLCIGLMWAFAAILTAAGAYRNARLQTQQHCRTDRSFLMSSAPWIWIPYPFRWGGPIFRATPIFGMMGAAIVTSAESTPVFYAAARLSGATSPPSHVVSRSIGLQGVGQLVEGMFGSLVGTTAAVENVGLLGLTRVGSRRAVQISAAFMIFFSIFGKFGAFFASIPLPIFAAIYCILYGIVAATGISFLQFTNSNSMRNIYVSGVSLFLSISISQYFIVDTDSTGHGPVRTNGGWFNDILNTVFSSAPTVALVVGSVLDNTLRGNSMEDRGVPWLLPFHRRSGDSRNEEFYSYPLNVNEYIP